MNLRLHPRRAPGPQIRSFLLIEIDHALNEARRFDDADLHERVEVIRQIRKATKRARSSVSLLDPTVGDRFRRHVRRCARELSAMRDRDVIQQTLRELADEDPMVGRQLAKRHLFEKMIEFEDAEPTELLRSDGEVVASVRKELVWIRERIPSMSRRELTWKSVIERLSRSWQRARRSFRSEWSAKDIESLHDARKAVIRLESQLVLVERIATPRIRRARKALRQIAHDLGVDRDFMMVCDRAESLSGSRKFAEHRGRFTDRVRKDRGKRLRKIRTQGKRVLEAQGTLIRAKMLESYKHAQKGGS